MPRGRVRRFFLLILILISVLSDDLPNLQLTHSIVSTYIPPMPTNLKLDDKLIDKALKLGPFKTKQQAVNSALEEFVHRRERLRILELEGKIDFDPTWDYKKMRRGRG